MQQGANDYKQLLTDVIKKQIVILGPDITLAKARNVSGLTVSDDGTVTAITGEPQQITQSLIDQFVQLSGLIVKKTMEPLLSYHQDSSTASTTTQSTLAPSTPASTSTANAASEATPTPPSTVVSTTPPATPNPVMPTMPSPMDKPQDQPVEPKLDVPNPLVEKPQETKLDTMPTPVTAEPKPIMPPSATPTGTPASASPDQLDSETQKIIDEALKSNA